MANLISSASDLNVQRYQCAIEIKVGYIWPVTDGFSLEAGFELFLYEFIPFICLTTFLF